MARLLKAIFLPTAGLLALSACGWLAESPATGGYDRWESAAAETPPPPQTRIMQTAEGTWLEPDRRAAPVPNATELAELKQAKMRIAELEEEVSSLRNDMNMMMPALTKLAGVQMPQERAPSDLDKIQPAAGSVEAAEVPRIHRNYMQAAPVISDNPEAAMDSPLNMPPVREQAPVALIPPPVPPVPAAPVAAPMSPPAPAPQAASYTPPVLDVTSIQGIRFGNHEGGKSRLVIDMTAQRSFKYDIDNQEHILMVEIPGTVWNAGPVTRAVQDNPLIRSVSASPDGQGGTRMAFELNAPAKILWSQAIPPSGQQGHRIVLDIAEN